MKKLFYSLLMVCLVVPCLFFITACNKAGTEGGTGEKNYASQIAGSYSNYVFKEDSNNRLSKNIIEITINENGQFKLSSQTDDGIENSYQSLKGTLTVDENKKITNVTFDNVEDALRFDMKFLGNELPIDQSEEFDEDMIKAIQKMLETFFEKTTTFGSGYMALAIDDPVILYTANTDRLPEGTVVSTWTEKDIKLISASMMELDLRLETDYYFQKDEVIDLIDEESMASFANSISLQGFVVDEDGNIDMQILKVDSVSGLNLAQVGTGNATLKYTVNEVEHELKVTYTVVETEDQLPQNRVTKVKVDSGNLAFVEKDFDLYSLGLELEYETSTTSYNTPIEITSENCTGENPLIVVTGYDNTKTGYQEITFTYKGASCKIAVYVYDENDNPVVDVKVASGAKLVITKTTTGTTTNYELDYSQAKIIEVKADNTESAEKTLSSANALNLKTDLSQYEDGDSVYFKYDVTNAGETYSFYIYFEIEIVNA